MSKIKDDLRGGRPTVGSWMQIPSPSVAEIMAHAGFDWVALDLEHGSFSLGDIPDLCRALVLGGAQPFVRVATAGCTEIKQAIEAGARGIILPMIASAAELEQAIAWAHYPPRGSRGVGFSRANLFGRHFQEHFDTINDELVIVAQIESIRAVEALTGILAVPGLDAIMVGPYDLSASMGLTGRFNHPDFQGALSTIVAAARRAQIPMGLHVVQPDPAVLQAKIAEGYQFIAYGIDAVFLNHSARNPLSAQP